MHRMGIVDRANIRVSRNLSDLSLLGLQIKASAEIRVGDRKIYSEYIDPATPTLISHIEAEVYSATDNAAVIGGLTRICLGDQAKVQKDCATLVGADITYDDPTLTLRVTKTISVTSSYTAAYVFLDSTDYRYFETPISATSVASGDAVTVTWQATITATPSLSGLLAGSDYDHSGLSGIILRAIGGKRGYGDYAQSKIAKYLGTGGMTLLEATLTRDPVAKTASHPATNFTTSGGWIILEIYNPNGIRLIAYVLHPEIAPLPVTTQDSIRYTFAARWS